MRLDWNHPKTGGFEILKYRIFVRWEGNWTSYDTEGNMTSFVIEGLQAATLYDLAVAGTGASTGYSSQFFRINVQYLVASFNSDDGTDGGQVQAALVGETFIALRWTPPNATFMGYVLALREPGTGNSSQIVTSQYASHQSWRRCATASIARAVLRGDLETFEKEAERLRGSLVHSRGSSDEDTLLKQLAEATLHGRPEVFRRCEQQLRQRFEASSSDSALESFRRLRAALEVQSTLEEIHPTPFFELLDELEERRLVLGAHSAEAPASVDRDPRLSFVPLVPLISTALENLQKRGLDDDCDGGVVLQKAAQALLYAADDPSDVTAELRSTWRRRALGLLRRARELMQSEPDLAELCSVATLQMDLTEDGPKESALRGDEASFGEPSNVLGILALLPVLVLFAWRRLRPAPFVELSRPRAKVKMQQVDNASIQARDHRALCLCIMLGFPPNSGKQTLPEFAYRMLSTTGALSEKRAAWPVYHNLLRERENPFIFGRRLTLMQGIWDEWKATHPPCGGAHTLAPRNALEGLQSFGEEALAAVARLVHQRPSTLKEKGFMEAAKKEWDQMSVPHQLLWATKSVARAKSSPPKSTPRPKKRKRSSTPGQQMPLLPPGFHKRSTPSSDIYGQGSEAAFSHPLVQSLLEHARKRVSLGLDWVLCVRSYARSGLDPESGKTQKGGIMSLTLKMLEELGLLSDAWFQITRLALQDPESRRRLHIFVAHDDPHFTKGCYEKLLGDLGDRLVVGVRGADLQVRFIEECFPIGQHVVVCDDNIVSLQLLLKDLSKQILHAAKEMNQTNAHLWGISPTNNTMFLQNAHELKSSLGLIFGAFFGFIVLHEPKLYTQHGQDDLERTLRYWDRDHIVLRFSRVFCKKNFKPGAFYKSKGGISASLGGREAHQAEAANALQKLVREFYRYIRLPAPAYDQKKDEKGALVFIHDGAQRHGVSFKLRVRGVPANAAEEL
eukprot:g9018.t1